MKDISFLLTSFNRLWCLPKAVESCRDCGYDYEIIVADDGSNDGTWEWLEKQPDIRPLKTPEWGQTWALNCALDTAEGRYIRFLDSDDWICPGANDRQLKIALETDVDIVLGGSEKRNEDGELIEFKPPPADADDFLSIYLVEMPVPHYSANLFKREFLGDDRFLQPFPAHAFAVQDDLRFMLTLGLKDPSIHITTEPATCILHHDKGRLMHRGGIRRIGTLLQFLMIYRRIIARAIAQDALTPQRAEAASSFLWRLADMFAREGHIQDAAAIVDWIQRINPGSRPPFSPSITRLIDTLGFAGAMRFMYWRRKARDLFRPRKEFMGHDFPVPEDAQKDAPVPGTERII